METNEKYQKLDKVISELGLTKEELSLYFDTHISLCSLDRQKVKTPLPIVYKTEDGFENLDYLDLARKKEVWGLKVGNAAFCKDVREHPFRYSHAKSFRNYGDISVPNASYLLIVGKILKVAFNETITLLNGYDIKAHNYGGKIWCFANYEFQHMMKSDSYAPIFNATEGLVNCNPIDLYCANRECFVFNE